MEVVNPKGHKTEILFLDRIKTKALINKLNGKSDISLRKKWTARTFRLSDGKILLEFYDGQSALIQNEFEFKKLDEVRFIKNSIWNLKKNISYKINLPFEDGELLAKTATILKKYKSKVPNFHDFKVYEMDTKQILFLQLSEGEKSATIYPDIKTLASSNINIQDIEYGFEDDEYFMKELANGNSFDDYEPNEHLVYPNYLDKIISNHKLSLIDKDIYVSDFKGNLYESQNGYFILIDDVKQANGNESDLQTLELRKFNSIDEVRSLQKKFKEQTNRVIGSKHFFQHISDEYGNEFPNKINSLITTLPRILNIEADQLTIDEKGIEIADEAIHWNHFTNDSFNSWFPAVLAFYGEFYIQSKKQGKWQTTADKESNVIVPQIILQDNSVAFDVYEFYCNLYEWPIPLKIAGDFDGRNKRMRKAMLDKTKISFKNINA